MKTPTAHQATRTISLTEVCEIAEDVLANTAPIAETIGSGLEQIDHPVAQRIGGGLKDTARFFLNLLQMLDREGIQVVDQNGSRTMSDQRPVLRALRRIQHRMNTNKPGTR